jgi:hypothetical protein
MPPLRLGVVPDLKSVMRSIVLQNDFEPRSEENFFQIKAE